MGKELAQGKVHGLEQQVRQLAELPGCGWCWCSWEGVLPARGSWLSASLRKQVALAKGFVDDMRARYLELEEHTQALNAEAEDLCRQVCSSGLLSLLWWAHQQARRARHPWLLQLLLQSASLPAEPSNATQLRAAASPLLAQVCPHHCVQVMMLRQQKEQEAQGARHMSGKYSRGPPGPTGGAGSMPHRSADPAFKHEHSRGGPGGWHSPPGQGMPHPRGYSDARGYEGRTAGGRDDRKRSPAPEPLDERFSRRSR